jgi:glutamyl-Q tRNA(Asp) synthetase
VKDVSTPQAVFRFAPSPNGDLHLGHALSALTGFDMARRAGGRFLVRVEDIDTARCRDEHIAAQLADLAWLGLTWEEPVLRQSQHFATYLAAADRLSDLGLLYPCFATRQEIATVKLPRAADPDGAPLYPGLHKHMPADEVADRRARGEPFALRLDMDRALALARARLGERPLTFTAVDAAGSARDVVARPERWGDAIIVRKDVPASYHLAVVVDDARQGVTHVTRGMDLYAATDLHRLLQLLLDLPAPLYHHHRLISDVDGRKLAKSARDTSLASLRQSGITSTEIRAMVGFGQGDVNFNA